MGVTVRSKTDPIKAFTLYVDSFGSPEGSGRGLAARVAVEGEAYRNNENRMGFGCGTYYKENTRVWDYADVNGSFSGTNLLNKKSGNQNADPYVKMRFKPDTMEVQVRYDGQWHTVRTLSGTSKEVLGSSVRMDRQAKYYNNLQAVDFAGGYTVEVALVHMNTNDNKGLELMCALENGSVTTEAIASNAKKQATYNTGDYERPGVIKIVEYKENDGTQQSLSSADITAPKATANGYNVAWNYEEIAGPVEAMDFNENGNNNVGIKFESVSLFGRSAIANKDVNVTYACDTDSSIAGTIDKTDANGVAGFNATRPGMYKLTYNGVTYTTAVNSDNQFYVYYDADVTDGEDDYKFYYVGFDRQVKFADLAPKGLAAGETLVGYTIEGQEGIYALDYVYTIPTTFESGAEKSIRVNPVIVDFAAASGASVRIATDGTSGLRFRAYMSKSAYEALGGSASFSVAMAMENGTYGAMKALEAKNIFAENRNGADIYSMTAAIYNVEKVGAGLTQNFKAKFAMTITYVGGETATFEVETALKNLKDVATALKADAEYETLSLAQQAIVDGFAGA